MLGSSDSLSYDTLEGAFVCTLPIRPYAESNLMSSSGLLGKQEVERNT